MTVEMGCQCIMQNQQSNRVFYGGFFVRLAAAWLDAVLVSLALLALRLPLWLMSWGSSPLYQPILFRFSLWDIFLYLLGSVYYILLTYTTGATLGKKLFSLRVVAADGKRLSLWDVLYRETIGKYLSGAFLGIGYLMAGLDREKRAFHDILSDTRVVYAFSQPEPVQESQAMDGGYQGYQGGRRYEAPDYASYQRQEDYQRQEELENGGTLAQETPQTPENPQLPEDLEP